MKKKPRYVSSYRDRHGVLRWRFRRPGFPQSQSRSLYGSDEWWAWYAAASDAQAAPIGAERTKPGTIHALGVAYYGSSNFTRLRPSTQRTYKGIFDRYRDKYGSHPVALLEARHIRSQMDEIAKTPAAANNQLKVLRSVMGFAVDRGLIREDPTRGVKMLRYRSDGFHSWTEAEIAQFQRYWPVGSKQRLAFDLLLFTAQRSSDVREMTRPQVEIGRAVVRQVKTGQLVDIAQHPRLATSLETYQGDQFYLLMTQEGKPYSEKGFGNWIKKAAVQAGLPHCSAHGIRKAAARRLADAGCTVHEIMSITGHQSLKEVQRYTREAGRRALADAAIGRI